MSSAAVSRTRAPLALPLFAGAVALVLYAAFVPLGLSRVGTLSFAEGAIALGGAMQTHVAAPLALLVAKVATFLPLGDLAVRVHVASVVPGAIAIALLVVYLGRLTQALRPATDVRPLPRDLLHEPIARVGCAAGVAFAPGFAAGSTQGGSLAVTAALVIGGLMLSARALATPGDARVGLGFVFLCGLAAGADPLATIVLWPPALLLWLSALRQGERWSLLAPFVFMLGTAVLLMLVAIPAEPRAGFALLAKRLALAPLREGLAGASGAQAWALLGVVVSDLGVVGTVLALVGTVVLIVRVPAQAGLLVFAVWAVLLLGSAVVAEEQARILTAAGLLEFLAAPMMVAGVLQVGSHLGKGRVAAVLAIVVIAAVGPVLALSSEQDSIIFRPDRG